MMVPSSAGLFIPTGLEGLGAGQIIAGSIIDTGFGTTADCSKALSWIANSGCWAIPLGPYGTPNWQSMSAGQYPTNIPAPSVPTPPTQAQLDAVAASPDPGTAAAALAQSLSNAAVTQTQANDAAWMDTTVAPAVAAQSQTGTGGLLGSPLIAGVPNWALLAAAGVGVLLIMKTR